MTREEEYDEIRNLLDDPMPHRPTPFAVLSGQFATEQRQSNRLSNTGRGWTVAPSPLMVSIRPGLADYPLDRSDFGKLLYAYRAFSDGRIVPVPHTDFGIGIGAPSYDVWMSGMNVTGRKIGIIRDNSGAAMLRVFPSPTEAETIQLIYAAGVLEDFNSAETPVLAEFARHRCLQTSLFLLPKSEWEGYSRAENRDKRMELKEALAAEFALEEKEFDQYVKNPTHETVGVVGYWFQ